MGTDIIERYSRPTGWVFIYLQENVMQKFARSTKMSTQVAEVTFCTRPVLFVLIKVV